MNRFRHLIVALLATMTITSCATLNSKKQEPWTTQWALVTTWGEGGVPSSQFDRHWYAGQMLPGKFVNRPHYDPVHPRSGILELHPITPLEPARLTFIGTVPLSRPILVVEASGNVNGDCILDCRVNGESIGAVVLDGSRWTRSTYDLSEYLGSEAQIELWVVAGGQKKWHFEHGYIDDIYFEKPPAD
ncbi:MAG TPA: hypothetical protein PKE26_09165 [Kiritimatiellia bacterium]|nr:hypothetical protein [Kiritimatiellia bacterium]HMO99264.1 hypothetical protein [Kiritimatiellia bacterium]